MQVTKLKAYLEEMSLTMRQFADHIGCNPSWLSAIAHGKVLPSPRLAKDIAEATDGVINLPHRKKGKKEESNDISRIS